MLDWIYEHLSVVGYMALIWVVPVAIVYLSNKLFNRWISPT
jgi:hypothetical protein